MEKCTQEQRLDSLDDRVDTMEERMKTQETLTTDIRLILAKQSGAQLALMGLIGAASTIGSLVVQILKG